MFLMKRGCFVYLMLSSMLGLFFEFISVLMALFRRGIKNFWNEFLFYIDLKCLSRESGSNGIIRKQGKQGWNI